ncbi:MAG TPA: hypothetical protein PK168_01460 [Candidatus Paceibacterota bacterium]|jgi:hypothetical protein|nr:hypothetical protein [Candidatus Paceibacterota bacterium]HPC37428.1 hypothetical protein [Candidatus Paceibacterota bacterium]HRU35901.1 hypothetical protein [Candidatus Paceibacterota bacterium]
MKAENIYIDINDSVSDVVEKIINSSNDNIILIIPENAKISESILNFRLIKREATSANKTLYINSDIEEVLLMAKDLDIKIVKLANLSRPKMNDKVFLGDIRPPQKRNNLIKKTTKDNFKKSVEFVKENKEENEINFEEEKNKVEKNRERADKEKPMSKEKKEEIKNFNKTSDKKFFTDYFKQEQFNEIEISEREMKRIKPERKKIHFGKLGRIILWGIGIVFVFAFIFIYFLANAKVSIISNKYNWEKELPVIANTNIEKIDENSFKDPLTKKMLPIDENNLIIPLEYFEMSRNINQTFKTTEVKNIESKAKGVIRIYNAYNSSSQTLVATTRFMSPDGKIFRLIDKVVVPGAKIENGKIIPSYIDAEVVADKPGESYNIGPTKFTIPGFQGTPRYETFYGESLKPMTGGYIGETKIVGQSDVNKAKQKILDIAFVSLNEELKSKIPPTAVVLDDAKQLILVESTTTPKIGEKADEFELSAKVVLKSLVFDENDIKKLFEILARQENSQLNDKELFKYSFNYGAPRVDFSDKKLLSFPVLAKLTFRDKVNEAEFKNQLSGKSTKELEDFFRQYKTIEKVDIFIWPSFLKFMPLNNDRIQVMVDENL